MQEMNFKLGTIAERRVKVAGLDFVLFADPDDDTAIEDALIESDPPTEAQVQAYRRGDWRYVVVSAAPVLFPEMPAHLLGPDIDPELTARLFGNWVGRWPDGDGTGCAVPYPAVQVSRPCG